MYIKNNIIIYLLFLSQSLFAVIPQITSNNSNIMYKQFQSDIDENRSRLLQDKQILPVQFYFYEVQATDTIFTVSSRFNITYDSIASLNDIDNQLFFPSKKKIILPTCPGIYTKENIYDNPVELDLDGKIVFFYPGKKFTGRQRLDFLMSPFSSPLKTMVITSPFGYRENPFTNIKEFHSGLDLKATIGTKVYTPYRGTIAVTGYSEFYGNYLIIEHTNGYSSHYYHLKKVLYEVGYTLKKGDYVAVTGNSGKSTGPHLHFEIQKKSEPINPTLLLGNV